jgi:hypothetical protein
MSMDRHAYMESAIECLVCCTHVTKKNKSVLDAWIKQAGPEMTALNDAIQTVFEDYLTCFNQTAASYQPTTTTVNKIYSIACGHSATSKNILRKNGNNPLAFIQGREDDTREVCLG